jgi:predicted NBD/HSP70 family sugar kinase
MAITGDQRLLKRINRMALVRLVRSQPGLSRAELSSLTGLTKSTVSLLVQELIDDGWLCEDSILVTGAIGRRPTPLRLDGQRLVLIGAELGIGSMCVVRMSLDGCILGQEYAEFSVQTDADSVLGMLADLLGRQVELVGTENRHLLGIGIGVPGSVREDVGILVVAPNLGWRNVPVKLTLETALLKRGLVDIPLFVQNDCDVAALGEVEFANSAVGDPLLYLGLGVGVGAGVVVGGRLLLGATGFAGEVGHIQLQADGPRCSCGRSGCAEAYFGLRSMAQSIHCDVEELQTKVKAGDSAAIEVLRAGGKHLGMLMHNLWVTLDPGAIVLGGQTCSLGNYFVDSARSTFNELAHAANLEVPPVTESRFGSQAVATGAAALVLHELLLPI